MRHVVMFALALIAVTAQARSATAAVPYTHDDVQQLVQAVLRIPVDHQFLLALQSADSGDMPVWDPIAHYLGPVKTQDGRTAYAVLVTQDDSNALSDLGAADPKVGAAVASAVFLAVIDAGRAGDRWKKWYDAAAAADAALPNSVADRYLNRHALVADLADSEKALYQSIAGPDVASHDEFGLPITEPIDYGSGLVADARAGIAADRLVELFEHPGALSRRSTMTFIDAWFDRYASMLPDDRSRKDLAALRPLFVNVDESSLMKNEATFAQAMDALSSHLPGLREEAFGVGYDASEIRYNALAIRHADEDTILRKLIVSSGALDEDLPGLGDLRAQLGSVKVGDWRTEADVAGKIVEKILPRN